MNHKSWLVYKIFFIVLGTLFILFTPNSIFAEGEFSSSYNVSYEVLPSGETQVIEQITLKNLTDNYYASSSSISIGATKITEVAATDSSGPLQAEVSSQGQKTNIKVNFNQQVTGKDKEYKWTLRFKSRDFAENIGKIWQVSIPRISSSGDLANFNLNLIVPVSFGDPTTILPEPKSRSEIGGKLQFQFNKEQLLEGGILANFGTDQTLSYKLKYKLENTNSLPAIARLSLPADTEYQKVLIEEINPKPENVIFDGDGNYIALFKIDKHQKLEVEVRGSAKLFIHSQIKAKKLTDEERKIYTSSSSFWEKDNPAIKTKLAEIFQGKNPQTNQDKARLIHRFVSTFLQYDESRLNDQKFERFGAITILNNPTKALCLEYTDLFIALSRAAGIPSRELTGYAHTSNSTLRPLSLEGTVLHAWPQYYDDNLGWVMIDPTWESTTGGVDYFSKFDLNHFVLSIRGTSPDEPIGPDIAEVEFSELEFNPQPKLVVVYDIPDIIYAGFPTKVNVKLENRGSGLQPETTLSLTTSKISIDGSKNLSTPAIPAHGSKEYILTLVASPFWQSYEDIIQIKVGDEIVDKKIQVKPFFALKFLPFVLFGSFLGIILIYFLTLHLHLRHSIPEKLVIKNPPSKKK